MTSQHKDLTNQHNYLTTDGRNMPSYKKILQYYTVILYLFKHDYSCFALFIILSTCTSFFTRAVSCVKFFILKCETLVDRLIGAWGICLFNMYYLLKNIVHNIHCVMKLNSNIKLTFLKIYTHILWNFNFRNIYNQFYAGISYLNNGVNFRPPLSHFPRFFSMCCISF